MPAKLVQSVQSVSYNAPDVSDPPDIYRLDSLLPSDNNKTPSFLRVSLQHTISHYNPFS